MNVNKAIALTIGLAAFVLSSVTAHAALVKWTLNDVQLAAYDPYFSLDLLPNPVIPNNTAGVAATGWFIYDTTAGAVADWNISLQTSNFSPGCKLSNDLGCVS